MNFIQYKGILLKIIFVVLVTTCTAETIFSSLRRTKTCLRSTTIGEDRLNGLMFLDIHRDIKILLQKNSAKKTLKKITVFQYNMKEILLFSSLYFINTDVWKKVCTDKST